MPGRGATAAAALAALGLAAAALAGCAPGADGGSGAGAGSGSGSGSGSDGDFARATLHPVGPDGAWLSSSYAAGSVDDYATPNIVCAVTGATIVELQEGPGLQNRVIARSLETGAVLWEREGARCFPAALTAAGSVALLDSAHGEDGGWSLLDPETGVERGGLPLAPNAAPARSIGTAGDTEVFSTAPGKLVGVAANEVAWTTELPANAEIVPLDAGRFGVSSRIDDAVLVIDGATGDVLHETTYPADDRLVWASDGYVERINQSDPEYAFFDVFGAEQDRTVRESQYPFVPSPEDGVTFSIADHARWGTVVGVDSSGRPALWQGENRENMTPAGPISELPSSIIALQGVSTDGSLLMFREDDALLVLDSAGETVIRREAERADIHVESGYIVLSNDVSTRVLLPRN